MIDLEIINYSEDDSGNKGFNVDKNGKICLYGLDQNDIIQFDETIKHLSKELTKLKNLSKKEFSKLS